MQADPSNIFYGMDQLFVQNGYKNGVPGPLALTFDEN